MPKSAKPTYCPFCSSGSTWRTQRIAHCESFRLKRKKIPTKLLNVFGCRPLKSFCSLVMEALTECTARQLLVEEEWSALITDERRDHSLPCLPPMSCLDPKSVLCRLLRVQSLGDVDFERLYAAYDDLVARFRDGSLPYDKMRWTHPHMTADWVQSDGQDDIRLVQRYRISSTARDCSIMIAFQRLPDDFKYYIHERPQSVY